MSTHQESQPTLPAPDPEIVGLTAAARFILNTLVRLYVPRIRLDDAIAITVHWLHARLVRVYHPRHAPASRELINDTLGLAMSLFLARNTGLARAAGIFPREPRTDADLVEGAAAWYARWSSDNDPMVAADGQCPRRRLVFDLNQKVGLGHFMPDTDHARTVVRKAFRKSRMQSALDGPQKELDQEYLSIESAADPFSLWMVDGVGRFLPAWRQLRGRIGKPRAIDRRQVPLEPEHGEVADEAAEVAIEAADQREYVERVRRALALRQAHARAGSADEAVAKEFELLATGDLTISALAAASGISKSALHRAFGLLRKELERDLRRATGAA